MIRFFQKKKKQSPIWDKETENRILSESRKQGKEQVLFVRLVQKPNARAEVQVSFLDRSEADRSLIRFEDNNTEKTLGNGEFRFQDGNIFFFPNVDLEWKDTSKPYIHRLQSNYVFSKEELYLEPKDYQKLLPILRSCFLKENVLSIYMKGSICQLEIKDLTKEKEERISEMFLTYFSSFYFSPLKLPHHHQ